MGESNASLATRAGRPALPDVLAEHIEELAFLGIQRRKLIFSTEFPLRRLPAHDERIAAHVDGLRIGGAASVALAREHLADDRPWLLYAAARTWLERADPDDAELAARLEDVEPEALAGWRQAVRELPAEVSCAWLPAKLELASSPALRALAVEGALVGGELQLRTARSLAEDPSPTVRAVLARGLPRLASARDALELAHALSSDEERRTRRCALWSGARLDRRGGLERLRSAVDSPEPDPFALRALGLLGEPEDTELCRTAATRTAFSATALHALAELGTPTAVEALLAIRESSNVDASKRSVDALEAVIGDVPRANRAEPPSPVETRAHWNGIRAAHPRAPRFCAGRPLPWSGEASEEPLRWIWRAAILAPRGDAAWLRHEVPDGFFDDELSPFAIPGE